MFGLTNLKMLLMLITEDYRKQQELLHENDDYGVASVSYAPIVSAFIDKLGITEILDYGAGKGRLAKNLRVNSPVSIHHYDPAIPKWSDDPDSAQMVCCIDVLEHVEPELIDDVLDHLQSLVEFYGLFTVHTGPAVKTLPDGRNAHLIQEPPIWWLQRIMVRFELMHFSAAPNGFYVLVKRNGNN